MKILLYLGRFLYALIFMVAGFSHFSGATIQYAQAQGVPMASLLVPLSGVMAILGGASIALGVRPKIGAWLIILFLIPVTLMMHNFWAVTDPNMQMVQQVMFMKNVSMLGAAMIIAYSGTSK